MDIRVSECYETYFEIFGNSLTVNTASSVDYPGVTIMVEAIILLGGMGLIIGAGLAFASKIFYVYVDPMILEVEGLLPGANCGGCGLPGCSANAEAIVAGKASPASCVAAGEETAAAIAAALGVSIEAREPDIARPGCIYGVRDAVTKYSYQGLSTCQAAAMLYGGMKECGIGCLGLGSCEKICPFNAIRMGDDDLPVVDEKLCTGCGACERVCPKNIITLSSVTRRILKEYTTNDCTTPCQRACPAGIDICAYIGHINTGDYQKAVEVIKERNPFPTVIGRICPRPCETECRRNLVDEPVAINFLKRYAADYEKQTGAHILPYKAPDTHRRVAIIGGGVEGLSAAFFSARLGHAPVVFEAGATLGGLLRTAIAQYRLPPEILDWDIAGVLAMGVETRTRQTLGKDFTVASLLAQGFEAVFTAAGGWDSRTERLGGAPPEQAVPGVHLLIDLIKSGLNNRYKFDIGPDTVIFDSGEMTMEAVKICRHLGAKKISVIFRDPAEKTRLAPATLSLLQQEGVDVLFNTDIFGLSGRGNNLTQIACTDGITGENTDITANTLIIDSGRLPELIFYHAEKESSDSRDEFPAGEDIAWVAVTPSKNPEYAPAPGLLAEGDVITDFSAAIRAIAAGRRAAASIHKVLYGIDIELPDNVVTRDTVLQCVNHIEENIQQLSRQIMPQCDIRRIPAQCREIEQGLTEDMARAEAARCLKCGLICYSDQSVKSAEAA
jgi:NADPH-dependent glutamate synthase beta subunit-like oxidoreductase/NAD-dependent dihydropyrimidine dehydrogenase PreA subunit